LGLQQYLDDKSLVSIVQGGLHDVKIEINKKGSKNAREEEPDEKTVNFNFN
jgi:hypothetical protein